ncbi:hypothetical protein NQZ68_016232 [Dissostichus eleginoides]|nr:hypothetical protein NQZ68_016232 [Dissostichus eleginoides]
MGQELSQCFLSDCRALRFHLWSKLWLSVPDCHTNPPHTTIIPVPTSLSPPVTTPQPLCWKEYQIPAQVEAYRNTADDSPHGTPPSAPPHRTGVRHTVVLPGLKEEESEG